MPDYPKQSGHGSGSSKTFNPFISGQVDEVRDGLHINHNQPRRSQTVEELDKLESSVSALHCRIDELETSLRGLLRDPGPIGGGAVAGAQDALVPVAEAIRSQQQRIEYSISRIADFLNRLEL